MNALLLSRCFEAFVGLVPNTLHFTRLNPLPSLRGAVYEQQLVCHALPACNQILAELQLLAPQSLAGAMSPLPPVVTPDNALQMPGGYSTGACQLPLAACIPSESRGGALQRSLLLDTGVPMLDTGGPGLCGRVQRRRGQVLPCPRGRGRTPPPPTRHGSLSCPLTLQKKSKKRRKVLSREGTKLKFVTGLGQHTSMVKTAHETTI